MWQLSKPCCSLSGTSYAPISGAWLPDEVRQHPQVLGKRKSLSHEAARCFALSRKGVLRMCLTHRSRRNPGSDVLDGVTSSSASVALQRHSRVTTLPVMVTVAHVLKQMNGDQAVMFLERRPTPCHSCNLLTGWWSISRSII